MPAEKIPIYPSNSSQTTSRGGFTIAPGQKISQSVYALVVFGHLRFRSFFYWDYPFEKWHHASEDNPGFL